MICDLEVRMRLNKVQRAAYELIQADARFLYTLVDMSQNASNISSNYIMMCQPYIGIFADGAEQWCKKLGLKAPLICCLLIRQQLRNLLRICLNKFPKSSNIWGTMFLQKKSVLRII